LTLLLVGVLVGLWGIVLFPVLFRVRQDTSPVTSIGMFSRSMRALGSREPQIGGRWVLMPMSPEDESVRKLDIPRRRQTFFSLLTILGLTMAFGLFTGFRVMLWAAFATAVVLAGFVVYLVYSKKKLESFKLIGDTPEQIKARRQALGTGNVVALNSPSAVRVRYPAKTPHHEPDLSGDEEFWQIPSFPAGTADRLNLSS
jgi:amino acid transporter